MKKWLSLLGVLIMGFSILGEAHACVLKIYPSPFEAKVKEVLTFRLERYPTHRRCVLPVEETKITVSKGTVVDPGTWKEGNPDVLEFKVRFDEAGEAFVRAERECPREGLIVVETKGTVTEATSSQASTLKAEELPKEPEAPSTVATPATSLTHPKESTVSITHIVGSINLNLWYVFFAAGVIMFLSNLSSYRKPLLFLSVVFLGFFLGGCPEPVGTIFYLLSRNRELFWTALILFAIPVTISFIWGRVFCGWICPLGAVQELMHRAQPHLNCYHGLPPWIDRPLKWAKFAVLFGVGYLTWKSATNLFSEYEPFKVLFNLTGTTLGIGILALTLLISLFLSRPFCRYICPLGAIFKITAPFSYFKVTLDEEACVECGLCTQEGICPMGAIKCKEEGKKPIINYGECIACLECKNTCKKGGLKVGR
ncbi:MAG: 4Fe-4S binding protein [Synergistetes bacterium]|nr:MAG: NapH protein [bacterium 42_11]MBC7331172.1 4Fe-4S binding protein [Synergistota bacterium]